MEIEKENHSESAFVLGVQLVVPSVCDLSMCVGPNDLPKYTISAYGRESLREFVGIKISYHMLISFLIF